MSGDCVSFAICDECRRSRRDAPAADQEQNKKTLLPAVPRRGHEAGNPRTISPAFIVLE
jgi:hypothetical protein